MMTMKTNRILSAALLALAVALPAALHAEEAKTEEARVELKIEQPKPMFEGTPRNITSANLETPEETKARSEPLMVPAGLEIISKGKPVTSSDEAPIIGELELITDGDKAGVDGTFVELAPGKQWVQIDLGEESEVHAVVIWHYHTQARVYRDVVAQLGDDPDFLGNTVTLFNNDNDNSAGLGVGKDKEWIETNIGRVIDAKGAKGRYLRLYSNQNTSNDMNHYVEVEVWGRKAVQ